MKGKHKGMRYAIRFSIGNRLGKASVYTVREICVFVVERYSLREHELCTIFTLQEGEQWRNEDMQITRLKNL